MFAHPGEIRTTQQTPVLCKQSITKAIISIIFPIFLLKDQINVTVRFSKTIAGETEHLDYNN